MKSIVLEKVDAATGDKPLGEIYTWTYTSSSPEMARGRAWRALKRDLPGENPTCWKEVV